MLSVDGSLASYLIKPQAVNGYEAVLRVTGEKRRDIPERIMLHVEDGTWIGEPWHDTVVPALIRAITSGKRE